MQGEDKSKAPPTLVQIMKMRPQNVHMGSKTPSPDGGVDIGDLIDASPCSRQYYVLEECLGEHDRNWSKCQVQVRALRECSVATSTSARTQKEAKT
jgi:hypothetical protein